MIPHLHLPSCSKSGLYAWFGVIPPILSSIPKDSCQTAGYSILWWLPQDKQPIKLNKPIHTLTSLLWFVAASAAKAELGALFVNAKEGKIICLILKELEHPNHSHKYTVIIPQPLVLQTILSRNNYYNPWKWDIADQVAQKQVAVPWHPGQENLSNCVTKHHSVAHHSSYESNHTIFIGNWPFDSVLTILGHVHFLGTCPGYVWDISNYGTNEQWIVFVQSNLHSKSIKLPGIMNTVCWQCHLHFLVQRQRNCQIEGGWKFYKNETDIFWFFDIDKESAKFCLSSWGSHKL